MLVPSPPDVALAAKQLKLVVVFGVYVALVPIVALVYWQLYRRDHLHFIFAEDLAAKRRREAQAEAERRAEEAARRRGWLAAVVEVFAEFLQDREATGLRFSMESRGREALGILDDRFTAHLRSGRTLVVERQARNSGAYAPGEFAPYVRVLDPDGREQLYGQLVGFGFVCDAPCVERFVRDALPKIRADLAATLPQPSRADDPAPSLWTYTDFVYFSAITQSTVGYGDILPNSTAVRRVVLAQLAIAYLLLVVVVNIVLAA